MPTSKERGSALLAVLWMSAALAAIAFSIATSVRGETDRTATSVDDARSYYLARGGIQRAILDMTAAGDRYTAGQPFFNYQFPGGDVRVDLIAEAAKLDINQMPAARLLTLLLALGLDTEHAEETAAAIVDWRSPVGPGALGIFDAFYAGQNPSFRAHHASIEEIEELLSVKGVTPELYYGTYERDATVSPARFVARGGLRDCVSVYGSAGALEVNNAAPAAMAALGVPADAAAAVVARRPFLSAREYAEFLSGNAAPQLRFGGNSIFTLRATARGRLENGGYSDLRRTVSAMVAFQPAKDPAVVVLRWYDRS